MRKTDSLFCGEVLFYRDYKSRLICLQSAWATASIFSEIVCPVFRMMQTQAQNGHCSGRVRVMKRVFLENTGNRDEQKSG